MLEKPSVGAPVASHLPRLIPSKYMIGHIVEKNLTVVVRVKNRFTGLIIWKHMRENIVEKTLTVAVLVKSHLTELDT